MRGGGVRPVSAFISVHSHLAFGGGGGGDFGVLFIGNLSMPAAENITGPKKDGWTPPVKVIL